MADLAIGISKTTVEALVNKVKKAIKEEAELWQTLERDTMFMKDELEMMQSFLKTVDSERIENNVMRTWVTQVGDLSYDAENRIESVLLMDTKRSFLTMFLRLLASYNCSSPETSPLDQAVAEVKLLKARVEEVRNRSMRYSLVNDSSCSISKPVTEANILAEAWCTAKKQGGFVDLAMLITENSHDHRVISLWENSGDHGTASVIRWAYESQDIKKTFKCRAWLKVAHPFNPHEFIRSLTQQFYTNSCGEFDIASDRVDVLSGMDAAAHGIHLVKEFREQLSNHRYLVVIEGLSNMAEWDALIRTYLPDSKKNGSRIVLSTQHIEIARLCAGWNHQVLELKKLPDNRSVFVFFHEGFQRTNEGVLNFGPPMLRGACDYGRLHGRSSDVDALLKLVSRAGSVNARVISVCGFPNVGKSSLVRSVFYRLVDTQTETPLFDRYVEVDVPYPFDFSKLCRRMHSFMSPQAQKGLASFPEKSKKDEEIIKECRDFFQSNRCLVVVDGLRSMQEWKSINRLIGLPSRILVVTEDKDIARYCAQQDNAIYEVKGLQFEASLQLFQQKFGEIIAFRDAQLLKDRNYVLLRCGGIPEVILALARFLRAQEERPGQLQLKVSRLKANFMHELESNPEFNDLRDLFAWMHFNIDELPQRLKLCILYQSVFPQVKIIRKSRFVRRWIAEGYSGCTDSKAMEADAGDLFEMHARQIANVPALHDNCFFHEYIKSRLMEERVIFFPPVVTELNGSRSITIVRSWRKDYEFLFEERDNHFLFAERDFSRLQSLTVHGHWRPSFIPCMMKSLRVLDLEDTKNLGNDELKRFLVLLPRLRFLSLRGHKAINHLPESLLSGLRHLQTLDIRGTSVVYVELKKLKNLQYLRAGTTISWTNDDDLASGEQSTPTSISSGTLVSCLPKFPRPGPVVLPCNGINVPSREIRHLKTLHTLGAINVNTADGGALLDEIYRFRELKKLEMTGINRKNSKKLHRVIFIQKNLESLSLQLEKDKHVVLWGHISPPSSVRSLKLYGHVDELPPRIQNMQNLRKLSLEMTRLFKPQDIKLLGRVPNLRTLRLHVNKDQDGDLHIASNLFSRLHEFEITCRSRLHVRFDAETMVKLEFLKVHCCNGSNMEFSGLEHLVSLKQVWLKGSYDNQLKEALEVQLANHVRLPKPSLKLMGVLNYRAPDDCLSPAFRPGPFA